ncbi:hypothetical protein [Pseudomonas aeruginosa]|uniref:hypothetical protein n=1 Tax=Pseudomonas aeruginosa TaxID=287 RepID=UPI0003D66F67|nr:hypothetical protein [Pseudomonas aeruginosa]AHC68637.1 hypothetical protein T223_17305 [Pseudomonas aeruginosa LES431]AHK86871.1 hypothetical protein T227_17250 [Pseudomonas aeruginosa LESlike5]AHK92745.1 hypothetical protein T228_16935 [Pseudomonas aeruginosa LESlike7]AHK98754.1 hypothetical protein T222_17640 [Pseudomonas aeruginosa LES400]AHL04712.1 hypothetical protein T224_17230 [Pseudomonas aeruginosa LESB65]
MHATIDWIADDEPNTPRGVVSSLNIGPKVVALGFRGAEAGQGTSWTGSIVLELTEAVQTVTAYYEEIPGPKMSAAIKKVPYTVTGCFSDESYKSFTGKWTEGVGAQHVYELNIDID